MSNPCDERPEIIPELPRSEGPINPVSPQPPVHQNIPAPIILFPRSSIREGDITSERVSAIIQTGLYLPPFNPNNMPPDPQAWDVSDFIELKTRESSRNAVQELGISASVRRAISLLESAMSLNLGTPSLSSNSQEAENIERLDPFRAATLSTWTFDGANLHFNNPFNDHLRNFYKIPVKVEIVDEEIYSNFESITKIDIKLDKSMVEEVMPTTSFNLDFISGQQFLDIYIEGQNSPFFDAQKHSQFKYGMINKTATFIDSVFDTPLPFFKQELTSMSIPVFNYADITHHHVGAHYETSDLSEYEMPNMYKKYFEMQKEESIFTDRIEPAACSDTGEVQKFPSDKISMISDANAEMRSNYSSFVEVTINTQQGNILAQFLANNKMDRILLDYVSKKENLLPEQPKYIQVLDETILGRDSEDPTGNDRISREVEMPCYSGIAGKISSLSSTPHTSDINEYPLSFTGYDNELLLSFDDAITSQIFLRQFYNFVQQNNHGRTFKDVLEGKKAYSEIVAYKVLKKDESDKVIQTFYFSDSNEVLTIDFRDTQIVPGKKYIYEIFAINMVVGTNISYNKLAAGEIITDSTGTPIRSISQGDPQGFGGIGSVGPSKEPPDARSSRVEFEFSNITGPGSRISSSDGSSMDAIVRQMEDMMIPNITGNERQTLLISAGLNVLVFETPFFRKEVEIYDAPPMFPQVSFLPFVGVDDRMSILFQANTGKITEQPISILPSDQATVQQTRLAQNLRSSDPITYGSDSLPEYYEMLVLDRLPYDYGDFAEAQYIRVPTSGKASIFTFEVVPNQDFYYVFRTVDAGGISNPTEVYRAKLVSYENGIFLDMEVIEMMTPEDNFAMTFERFLCVKPTIKQRTLNFSQHDTRDEAFFDTAPARDSFSVGNLEDSELLWNKRFKVRLKSITTGKALDLNIKYKIKIGEVLTAQADKNSDTTVLCEEPNPAAPLPPSALPQAPQAPTIPGLRRRPTTPYGDVSTTGMPEFRTDAESPEQTQRFPNYGQSSLPKIQRDQSPSDALIMIGLSSFSISELKAAAQSRAAEIQRQVDMITRPPRRGGRSSNLDDPFVRDRVVDRIMKLWKTDYDSWVNLGLEMKTRGETAPRLPADLEAFLLTL